MDTLFHRFGSVVKGVITGFDRIVFNSCVYSEVVEGPQIKGYQKAPFISGSEK